MAWFSGGITFWGIAKSTIGGIVIGTIAFVGAIVSLFTIGLLLKKSFGKPREISELEEKEKNIVYVCLELAKAFRLNGHFYISNEVFNVFSFRVCGTSPLLF